MSVKSSKSDLGDKMARTWSIGIALPNGTNKVVWADDVTFQEGMRIMYQMALTMPEATDNHEARDLLIADIQDIKDDPGIMEDSDQWEDEDFDGPNDEIWFIVEN